MINYYYETDFVLENEGDIENWVYRVVASEQRSLGEVSFIFCDDEYLLDINKRFLNHDYYTDIISFDSTMGTEINGDIFISIERVKDNASEFSVTFVEELHRVIIHGVLHFCGYKDKSDSEEKEMRAKENEKLRLFHVEQ